MEFLLHMYLRLILLSRSNRWPPPLFLSRERIYFNEKISFLFFKLIYGVCTYIMLHATSICKWGNGNFWKMNHEYELPYIAIPIRVLESSRRLNKYAKAKI